jgi:DNA/RNA endonuclease YhcR with UshA esterase domain
MRGVGGKGLAVTSFFVANIYKNHSMSRMKLWICVFTVLAFTLNLSADPANSPALMKIGTDEATNFYDKEMIVTGTVAQVSIRPGIVFLNLDKPYPKSPFTLVIFPAATNQFGNLTSLKGSFVEATGKIRNFHGRAEMVLEKAKQLKVTGQAAANSSSIE